MSKAIFPHCFPVRYFRRRVYRIYIHLKKMVFLIKYLHFRDFLLFNDGSQSYVIVIEVLQTTFNL